MAEPGAIFISYRRSEVNRFVVCFDQANAPSL